MLQPVTLSAIAGRIPVVGKNLMIKPAGEDLQARAERNYPDNPRLQAEWIRAVGVVRETTGGWVMDLSPLPSVPPRFLR